MKQLLHFSATWCQPCKQMEPLIAIFISENLDITYDKIDVSDNFDPAVEYRVKSIPTFIALKDGIEIARHTGVATKEKLVSLFS